MQATFLYWTPLAFPPRRMTSLQPNNFPELAQVNLLTGYNEGGNKTDYHQPDQLKIDRVDGSLSQFLFQSTIPQFKLIHGQYILIKF